MVNPAMAKALCSKYWGTPPTPPTDESHAIYEADYQKYVTELNAYNGIPPTANLLDARVKALPEGQIFGTITHGKGLMGPYGGTINVKDRWAIVAYVKALQSASN